MRGFYNTELSVSRVLFVNIVLNSIRAILSGCVYVSQTSEKIEEEELSNIIDAISLSYSRYDCSCSYYLSGLLHPLIRPGLYN